MTLATIAAILFGLVTAAYANAERVLPAAPSPRQDRRAGLVGSADWA